MATFVWGGGTGALQDPNSWIQSDPSHPAAPQNGDTLDFSNGGFANGVLDDDLGDAKFLGNVLNLLGSLQVSAATIGNGGELDTSSTAVLATSTITVEGKFQVGGASNVTATLEVVAGSGPAESLVTQIGGTHIVSNLFIGYAAGDGTYNMSNGKLIATTEIIGGAAGASGEFIQTKGNHTVANSLVIGAAASSEGHYTLAGDQETRLTVQGSFLPSGALVLGQDKGSTGSLDLNFGTGSHNALLTVDSGGVVVGDSGEGLIHQDGGKLVLTAKSGFREQNLILGRESGGDGTYQFDSGLILVPEQEIIGLHGHGTFTQDGGENDIVGNPDNRAASGNLVVGGSGGDGQYHLNDGILSALRSEFVGVLGSGGFNQQGGSNTAANLIVGSNGNYTIASGTLGATDSEYVSGLFVQNGGGNVIGNALHVGGNGLAMGEYRLSLGSLTAVTETIGDKADVDPAGVVQSYQQNGLGQFTQTGGSNAITGALAVGAEVETHGLYLQKGGTTSVGTDLTLGSLGTGGYLLNGAGSTLQVSGALKLGELGGAGTLVVGAGATATTKELDIGSAAGGAQNTVTADLGGVITASNLLRLYTGSTVDATLGAIDVGTGLTPTGGELQVSAAAVLRGAGTIVGNLVTAGGSNVHAEGGTLFITGAIGGSGTPVIESGATLELGQGGLNTVQFNGGAGATLQLDAPALYTGMISGIALGDIIHLMNANETSAMISGSQLLLNGPSGALSYRIAGDLGGHFFAAQSDGAGGTNLILSAAGQAPVILSDGAGDNAAVSAAENLTAVTTVIATHSSVGATLAYSIVGGADEGFFQIDQTSGVLTFVNAPNFENPSDSGHDNSYVVEVRATDGAQSDSQTVTVNVTDVIATTNIDLYITPKNSGLVVDAAHGVLANDFAENDAILNGAVVTTTAHGSLVLNADGSFSYTPDAGFVGTDSFTYKATDSFGESTTTKAGIVVGDIDALLTPEQQIGELYVGYYNRAPDPGGLNFWIANFSTPPSLTPSGANAFFHNLPQAADSFADPGQAETIALYPFLAHPQAASYDDVVDFVQDAYHNLFNRETDPTGEAFWSTAIAKSLGIPVPTFNDPVIDNTSPVSASHALIAFIFGALGADAQTVANKVTAGLYYKHAVEDNGIAPSAESAHAAFSGVTADPATVLASEATTNAFVQATLHDASAPLAAQGIVPEFHYPVASW